MFVLLTNYPYSNTHLVPVGSGFGVWPFKKIFKISVLFPLQIACIVVAALIQYCFLSAFCWMMCEGVMLYLMLVVVFSTLSKKWWFFLLLGWGMANHLLVYSVLITDCPLYTTHWVPQMFFNIIHPLQEFLWVLWLLDWELFMMSMVFGTAKAT